MKSANTTGLKRHLERYYKDIYDSTFSKNETAPDQRKLTDMLTKKDCLEDATNKETSVKTVRWMTQKYLPFNFFDDLETQRHFQFINPKLYHKGMLYVHWL